ncbi:MAG: sensor histidine kinase [Firmicutes bacterium]|nr:sensor histidine kinase [Bacillota bacterium]
MRWIIALHNRTPLFLKVLGANGFLVVVGALGGYAIARFGLESQDVLIFVALGLVCSLGINFFMLRIAFGPLFRLQQVMEAVRAGDFTARCPVIPGDPDVHRLTETFNLMLDQLNAYRQQVASQILRALEEERKRIARELHDETSQALTSIVISLEMMEQSLAGQESLAERVRSIREYTLQTLEEIRRLTYDLRPSILDDLGLVPAIRWYLRHRVAEAGLQTELQVDPELEALRLPEEVEVSLFRIIQEALTNVRKHSQATSAKVRLWAEPGKIRARVEDNGKGFVLQEALRQDPRGRGLGLVGMRERAALAGAQLRIDSAPGRGTVVELEVPFHGSRTEDSGALGR